MNNNMSKLAMQADVWCDQNYHGDEFYNLRWEEKFAELIIEDVAKIIDNLYHALPLEQAAVLLTLDENIKEHFYGVE